MCRYLLFLLILQAVPGHADDTACTWIESIWISGNDRTHESVILRALAIRPGALLPRESVDSVCLDREQRIRNLGIFGSVRVYPEFMPLQSNSTCIIHVDVAEKWTFFPIPLYYYDNRLGNVIRLSLIEFNLFGRNIYTELTGRYNPDRGAWSVEACYEFPSLFGSLFSFEGKGLYDNSLDYRYESDIEVYRARTTSLTSYSRLAYLVADSCKIYADLDINERNFQLELAHPAYTSRSGFALLTGLGIEMNTMNSDAGLEWGDRNSLSLGFSFPAISPFIKALHNKSIRVGDLSLFCYRVALYGSTAEQFPLDSSDDIRGIQAGGVSGNLVVYGNAEFRPYLFTTYWVTELAFYAPVFLDAGIGIRKDDPRIDLAVVPGAGIRIYPRFFARSGNGIRLDVGFNLAMISLGWQKALFVAFSFNKLF